jgi:TonB family protein
MGIVSAPMRSVSAPMGIVSGTAVLSFMVFALFLSSLPATGPLRAGIDVLEPKLIKKVEVDYPEQAIIDGTSGSAILNILIDEQGSAADIQIGGGIYYKVTQFAESAVKKWRFSPTFINGKPVIVAATVAHRRNKRHISGTRFCNFRLCTAYVNQPNPISR